VSNLIHNERLKYAATFFNNLGVAAFAAGAIVPLFSLDPRLREYSWLTPAFGFGGIFLGSFLMFSAFWLLGHLKE
jgi:hypothetical protein